MGLTTAQHLRKCAEKSKIYVMSLIGEIAGTVADALEELHKAKADKPVSVSVTIPVSGWGSDSDANYPQYYDILVAGVTAKDRAEVTVSRESIETAIACGLCPVNETMKGKIRVRSINVPTAAITAEYWLEEGEE